MIRATEDGIRESVGGSSNYSCIAVADQAIGAIGAYYTYKTYYDNRAQEVVPKEENKYVEIKPAAKKVLALDTLDYRDNKTYSKIYNNYTKRNNE